MRASLWAAWLIVTCLSASSASILARESPRFLLLTPFVDYPFFAPMKQGAADAARTLGVEVTFAGTLDGNVAALAGQAEVALGAGYAGIGINMIDAEAFDAIATQAAVKGIPLISFNVDDAKTPNARLATVGQNMPEAGRKLGEAMASMIPQGSHVLLTMHDPGITALEERAAGAKEALKRRKLKWTSLITGTDREKAVAKIKTALEADRSIRVVLSTGEADTQAAGLAIERHFNGKDYIAAGFDTGGEILRLVKTGILRLTVDQQPYAQGFFAVASLTLAHRSGLRPVSVDTGATLIEAKDVDRLQAVPTAQSSPKPTTDPAGTVTLPSFSMPQSDLLSDQAKRAAIELEQVRQRISNTSNDVAESRKVWDEKYLKPQIERLRAVFPVTITPAVMGGVPAEIIEPQTASVRHEDRVLINVHGGAFITGARYGGQAESIPIASIGRFKVVAVDYRLAPEHQFPAANEDVTRVYKELLKKYRPEKIGFYGCSAGGMITASLIPWFEREKLPRPGAIGIFCAGAIASQAGDSQYLGMMLDWRESVPGGTPPKRGVGGEILDLYFGSRDVRDPLTSPAYHAEILKKFPPTLLMAGSRDSQLSNVLYTHTQLIKAGVEGDLHVWEGMGHGFFAQPWSVLVDPNTPETREAWDVIVRFFERTLGTR